MLLAVAISSAVLCVMTRNLAALSAVSYSTMLASRIPILYSAAPSALRPPSTTAPSSASTIHSTSGPNTIRSPHHASSLPWPRSTAFTLLACHLDALPDCHLDARPDCHLDALVLCVLRRGGGTLPRTRAVYRPHARCRCRAPHSPPPRPPSRAQCRSAAPWRRTRSTPSAPAHGRRHP